MSLKSKQILSGIYLAASILAITGEVNESESLLFFILYYTLTFFNMSFAAKIYNYLIKIDEVNRSNR